MNAALPAQGIELMLYGMGTVLLFLVLLVCAMQLMSRIVGRWFPDPIAPAARGRRFADALRRGDTAAIDPQLLAAISAAVHAHRARSDD